MRLAGPMLGMEPPGRLPKARVLVPLGIVTVAGFLADQVIHGRL